MWMTTLHLHIKQKPDDDNSNVSLTRESHPSWPDRKTANLVCRKPNGLSLGCTSNVPLAGFPGLGTSIVCINIPVIARTVSTIQWDLSISS